MDFWHFSTPSATLDEPIGCRCSIRRGGQCAAGRHADYPIAHERGSDMRPVLDPARDLAGATPETLARALLRPSARPRPGRKAVRSDEVPVEEVPPDELRDEVPHLYDGV